MISRTRATAAVTVVALAADVAISTIAVVSLLTNGPTPTGYAWLAAANHVAWAVGVLVAVTGVLLAVQGRRRVTAWLVGAAAVTLIGSIGLRVIGLALSQATVAYSQQAESVNSLFLAMIGTGADLMLLPIAFAVAALVTFWIARRRGRPATEVLAA